jgi:hypothetical protein
MREMKMVDNNDDADFEIAKWRVTKREVLRVLVRTFHGRTLIDVRKWFYDAEMQLRPGKGISLPPESLSRLRRALRKTAKKMRPRDV